MSDDAVMKITRTLYVHRVADWRAWLRKHHGVDNLVDSMRDWSAKQGQVAGVAFAEGYRQHLGHSYPQDNILGKLLGTV